MNYLQNETQEIYEELPHLIFKVRDGYYCLNSKNIVSIQQYEGCNPLPASAPEIMGVFIFRGQAVPVINLRLLFHMPAIKEEYAEFVDMLEARKQDHIHWVDALEKSVETGEKFALTTDPSQCAFGKWYDNFTVENHSLMFHLRKIKEPHDKLHQTAGEILECKRMQDETGQEICKKDALLKAKEQYVPTVLRLIDETKNVFRDAYKEMLIMIGEENPIGVLVDEVMAVELLEKGDDLSGLSGENRSPLLTSTMKSNRDKHIVFLLDDEKLLEMYRHMHE